MKGDKRKEKKLAMNNVVKEMKKSKPKPKPKFEQYTGPEIDQIVTTKLAEFVQRQRDFRLGHLEKIKQETSLKLLKEKIDEIDGVNAKFPKDEQIKYFVWLDFPEYPIEIAKCEYNIQVHRYGELVSQLNKIQDNLVKTGLTNQQIKDLVTDYKLIKTLPEVQNDKENVQ